MLIQNTYILQDVLSAKGNWEVWNESGVRLFERIFEDRGLCIWNFDIGGEGWLGFPDLWSGQKPWLNWHLTPVVNFGEVRWAQLAKSTLLTSSLVPLGSFSPRGMLQCRGGGSQYPMIQTVSLGSFWLTADQRRGEAKNIPQRTDEVRQSWKTAHLGEEDSEIKLLVLQVGGWCARPAPWPLKKKTIC